MIDFDLEILENEIEIEFEEDIVGSGGTNDYEELKNKPKINEVELEGNKSFEELGITPLTNMEILAIITKASKNKN